jgi:transcriptional regulator with XRE-family HTH domain
MTAETDHAPTARLGAEIRRLRLAQGWSQEELAAKINFSTALVGFVERGERTARREFVEGCESALGLNGELKALWDECGSRSGPRWFRPWPKIEAEARVIRTWEPLVVPGLLQTPDYARALMRSEPAVSEAEVEAGVEARMQRQSILTGPTPPVMLAVIDEAVLLRPIGGPSVMHRQLEHLLDQTALTNIMIQVVPLDVGATAGLLGGFAVADVPGGRDAAYLESPHHGHVTDRASDIYAIKLRHEAIRAWAHPRHVSENLMREMLVRYAHE